MKRTRKLESAKQIFEGIYLGDAKSVEVAGIVVGIAKMKDGSVYTDITIDDEMTDEHASEIVNALIAKHTVRIEHTSDIELKAAYR